MHASSEALSGPSADADWFWPDGLTDAMLEVIKCQVTMWRVSANGAEKIVRTEAWSLATVMELKFSK